MKLILNSDVKSLGRKGDVVEVAKGYARNYLLPKKLAIVATANNLEFAQKLQEKRQQQAQVNNELAESIITAICLCTPGHRSRRGQLKTYLARTN